MQDVCVSSRTQERFCPAQTLFPPLAHSFPTQLLGLLRLDPAEGLEAIREDAEDGTQPIQEVCVASVAHALPCPPHTAVPPVVHSLPVQELGLLRLEAAREDEPTLRQLKHAETVVSGLHALPRPLHTALPPAWHSFPVQRAREEIERLEPIRDEAEPALHEKQAETVVSSTHARPKPLHTALPPMLHSLPKQIFPCD